MRVPIRRRNIVDLRLTTHSSVVDQNIQPAPPPLDFGDHLAHGVLVGDVGDAQQGMSVVRVDFIDDGLTLFH